MFGYYKRKIQKLIKTDEYKKSNYKFFILNGSHVLRNTITQQYVDLNSPSHEWTINNRFFYECKGYASQVFSAYFYVNPIIEEIKSFKEIT